MLALLTAVVFAQSSVSLRIGDNPKDSARAERQRRQDSSRLRYEIWRDSMIAARATNHDDSVDRARRRARIIPLTPALLANAFKDNRARDLLSAARKSRLQQDSSIVGYDATTYERMSVGLGFKRVVRDRLLMRAERATRVVWSRGSPAYVEVLGRRAVAPMLDGIGDADIDLDEAVPIPYYPGRETLWVGSGLAKADVEDNEIIHPLARGAEAYYTYAIGDSVSFQLPGGQRINLRELVVRPRAPRWNVAVGSLWFDISDARLVRGVFRMAEPMDIWAIAEEEARAEHDDDDVPKWLKGMVSPLKAQVNAVIIEYGLHEGRYWMPRLQSLEGSAQAGFMRVPFKMEQSFKYASVNGSRPVPIPQIAIADTATDSASRAARIARRRTDCRSGGTMSSRTIRSWENGLQMVVKTPCDTVALAKSPELPKSIYDSGDELFSTAEANELISQALTLGAQPGWTPQKPHYTYGIPMTRYNKIEALSTGIAASASLGQGYTASGSARIGIGDWQPNGELGISRSNGRSTLRLNAYRRLSSASDWTDPFSFSASLSAVLFGRDEGFYYRTAGIELAGTPDDSATTTWRLFAENHSDAEKKTNFSVAKSLGADGFEENIDAENGNIVGVQAERHVTLGLDPNRLRFFGSARVEGAAGSFKYGRGMAEGTVSRGLFKGVDGAVTVGAGSTVGDVPLQRFWYLGGSQTVRGQIAGTQFGDAFWMGRVELGTDDVGFRPVVFYDAGWAGDRKEFSKGRPMSGAGVGASLMDGLVRFDVARGIWPENKIRANLYVEARF